MQILIGGVDYSASYKPGTLRITERTGTDGVTSSLVLDNPSIPPAGEKEIVIWDSPAQRRKETGGRLKRPKQTALGLDGQDGRTARFTYQVEAGGYVRDITRRPPTSRVYQAKTTGFIFRDIATLCPGFSAANVTTGGTVQKWFETRHEKLPSVLERLARAEGWLWWVDADKVLHFEDPALNPAPFAMTDATWKEIAGDSLTVEPDTSNLANSIRLYYRGKYSEGMANVNNLSNQVTGTGTRWLSQVTPGSKFRLASNTQVVYTIQQVVSDTLIVLSSNYNEASLSGQAYVIEDISKAMAKTEQASVELMAAITGDDGIFADVIEAPGAYLTAEEAASYLQGILNQRAYPATNIAFKSTSYQVPGYITAGMSVVFKLTEWGIDTTLQLRQLTKTDKGAVLADGYPLWDYDFRFEVKLYDLAAQLRKLERQNVESSGLDTTFIDEIFQQYEVPLATETAGIAPQTLAVEEPFATETTAMSADIEGPFFWGPLDPSLARASLATDPATGQQVGKGTVNLVSDPDFTNGIVNWGAWGSNPLYSILSSGNLVSPGGKVLKWEGTTNGNNGFACSLTLSPDTVYTVTLWIDNVNGTAYNTGWFGVTGNDLYVNGFSSNLPAVAGFQTIKYTFVTKSTAYTYKLLLGYGNGGVVSGRDVRIHAVQVEKGAGTAFVNGTRPDAFNVPRFVTLAGTVGLLCEPQADNLIRNGRFSSGTSDWGVSNGAGMNGTISRVFDSELGEWCLEYAVSSTGSWSYFFNNFQSYTVAPKFDTASKYTLSMKVKKVAGPNQLYAAFMDSNASNIVLAPVYAPNASGWVDFVTTFTPAQAGNNPYLYMSPGVFTGAPTQTFRVARVQLEKAPTASTYTEYGSTRAADITSFPVANALDPSQGYFISRFWVDAFLAGNTGTKVARLWTWLKRPSSNAGYACVRTGDKWRFAVLTDVGAQWSADFVTTSLSVGAHTLLCRWKSGQLDLFLDGVKVATVTGFTNPTLFNDLVYLHGWDNSTDQFGAPVFGHRAGTALLSDAEAQTYSTGALGTPPGMTYAVDFNNTLTASKTPPVFTWSRSWWK